MLVRQNSGTMSAPADAWPSESGGTCAIRKKTRAAIHNDSPGATAPTAPMTWTYRRSAAGDLAGGLAPACRGAVIGSAGVGRGQHRAAPDDLVVQRRLVRAPDDLLPQRIVEPVAPVDHVPVRVGRHLPPDQRTGIDERQRVFQPREVQVSEPEE